VLGTSRATKDELRHYAKNVTAEEFKNKDRKLLKTGGRDKTSFEVDSGVCKESQTLIDKKGRTLCNQGMPTKR